MSARDWLLSEGYLLGAGTVIDVERGSRGFTLRAIKAGRQTAGSTWEEVARMAGRQDAQEGGER